MPAAGKKENTDTFCQEPNLGSQKRREMAASKENCNTPEYKELYKQVSKEKRMKTDIFPYNTERVRKELENNRRIKKVRES